MNPRCPLCRSPGGEVLWEDAVCRLVLVEESALPGYCRIVWKRHVRELSELSVGERRALQRVVDAAERAVGQVVRPVKLNVASLGNVVPHLHVHVVPRFEDDPWWPGPVWCEALRPLRPRAGWDRVALGRALRAALVAGA